MAYGRHLRLLFAVAVFIGALLLFDALGSAPARVSPAGEAGFAPRPAAKLDPAPFRLEIEAIERVLYAEKPAAWGEPEQVARIASELAERMHAELGRPSGHEAQLRLLAFAAEIEARAEVGYAAPDLVAPRLAWEELRRELFVKAAWFRRAAPELERAQRPAPKRADVLMLQDLRRWADAIDGLVAQGRRELPRFGQQSVDVGEGSREERELIEDWYDFARRWDRRVNAVGAKAPAQPPPDDALDVVMAHQHLAGALGHLRNAAVASGDFTVPQKWWREQSLDAAAAEIAEARRRLDAAP